MDTIIIAVWLASAALGYGLAVRWLLDLLLTKRDKE